MISINKNNLSEVVVTGEFDIVASVKPEQGSNLVKTVTLRFSMDAVPLRDIVQSSLKDKRINWQVGARAKFNSLQDKGIVKVDYRGGKTTITSKEQALATLRSEIASMSPEEKMAYLKEQGLL